MRNFLDPCSSSFLLVILTVLATQACSESDAILKDAIDAVDANVVFMRHAVAPGFGDPDNFSLSDCSTQRNLDTRGRKQARAIGASIQKSGIRFDQILSSEWCRCKEIVELLGIGQWQTFSGLNSFFQNYADKTKTLRELELKLKSKDGGMMFLVTHQVVIRAATGASVASGELVAFNSVSQQKKIFRLD